MNNLQKFGILILFLTLNFSCVNSKPSEEVISTSVVEDQLKIASIKFTSGMRCIYQDRNENYWFGSHREGVCLFDGKSFEYFTTEDGLSDNQVRTIQEDAHGNIWFGTANGVSSYKDGESPIILFL